MSQERHRSGSTAKPDVRATSAVDIPEGYRMTELGPLPEEWRVVKLGEVIRSVKGRKPPMIVETPLMDGLPYLTAEYFRSNVANQFVPKEFLNSGEICEKNDVVLIWDGSKAGQVFTGLKGVLASTMVRLEPTTGNIERTFLYFYLLTQFEILNSQTTGSTIPHVNKTLFFNLPIPLPHLPEQRAIAHVLRTVQRAKEATERVIQATRELKKSLMRYLFTYGPVPIDEAEKVPLKETEIGLVPEHWEVVKLENCLSLIRNGISKKQNATSKTGYPVTRIETISEDRINPDKVGYIDNLTPTEVEKFRLRPGDILFSHINSEPQIGRSVIYEGWPSTLLHGMNLLLLRTNSNTIPYWLNYLFMHYRAIGIFIKIAARAVNQSSINQSKMKSLPIPLPPLPEQHEIARILQAVDKKLQAEEARKQALEALFKTLLNNLMTGKIRVKDVVLPNVGEGKGDVTH